MATIVNTPAATAPAREESSSNPLSNLLVGLVIILVVAALFFYFLLPMIRNAAAPAQTPYINVPDKINVDVNPNAGQK